MCVCASETSRPRLFNWVLVMLITGWVVVVSAIAHSVPGKVGADELTDTSVSAALEVLFAEP